MARLEMIDTTEVEDLRNQLQRLGDGAHAHTRGKAMYYLGAIAGKPNAKFSNCSGQDFVSAVKAALNQGKWEELSTLMGRWW